MRRGLTLIVLGGISVGLLGFQLWGLAPGRAEPIPHGQDRMPGAALTPEEAVHKMTLPPGFTAEVVACEPDIVNPVAMTFDEKGRIWITESLAYPRHSPGPGHDRIKVLESTRGDGKYDKVTIFADDLNIPSGIAVGQGGVWVDNSPDILFLQDTRGTGRADKREVVVTGFGRLDTHEVPNSLTWGPDGYLYGLNGVFNPAHIQQNGKEFDFTCAMYRIHPKTREFQMFAEGTSNPWGMAWDPEGSVFISACVVDHLWHLAETGYYFRQGGPYPPHTWILPSIVRHHHQKAAYCGLCYFDSDAYPPEYRDKLYMGNIHGGCINVDTLHKTGSTYTASPCPDFLTANDAWFMPVSQRVGPDGCLYILDWYDRYHCYQDAQRDPAGIDRRRGRLYRIRYHGTPPAGRFDLAKESDDELLRRLYSPNIYFRDQAQRLLRERNHSATRPRLERLVLDERAPHRTRMHALWTLIGMGPLEPAFHQSLLRHRDPVLRAWAVRAAGNEARVKPSVRQQVIALASDPSPDVLLQVAVASRKIEGVDALPVLTETLQSCGHDSLVPAVVWQNLYPLLDRRGGEFIASIRKKHLQESPAMAALMPHLIEYVAGGAAQPSAVAELTRVIADGSESVDAMHQCFSVLAQRIENGELTGRHLRELTLVLEPIIRRLLERGADDPLRIEAGLLAATWKDPPGIRIARECLESIHQPDDRRIEALAALVAEGDSNVLPSARNILMERKQNSIAFRGRVLAALARLNAPQVATVVLAAYPHMEPDLQPRAIELLTQRPAWSKQLLQAIASKHMSADVLNANQARRLLHSRDPELLQAVRATWGTVRESRNPEREKVVARIREDLRHRHGDARAGRLVFNRVCGQCHRIYGQGQDVGPDLTANGRGSYDALLSNVFDPSLVIGAGYEASTVATTGGRILTGLVVENSPERVVLKEQGGKLDAIARRDIDEISVSKTSLMPEGLEKQLNSKELADLFAFLVLDRPPEDAKAKKIPGAP